MHLAYLLIPIGRLDGDPAEANRVHGLLSLLETELADATLALSMYEEVKGQFAAPDVGDRMEAWRAEADQRQELEEEVATVRGIARTDWDGMNGVRAEAEIIRLGELVEAGKLPRQYQDRIPFIHAKSFVTSMDAIRKTIDTLMQHDLAKDAANKALISLDEAMPDLAGVRNSTVHADERMVGKGSRNKPLVPAPIENQHINAKNGGVLVLGSLMGDQFSCTLGSGEFGSVEISQKSLFSVQELLQKLFDDLPWKAGPNPLRVSPSA